VPRPRRYQLRKDAVAIIERGHPWIFRDQLSSAAEVFRDGDWLRLVDGTNRVIGHGVYEAEGAIAIRIIRRGPELPDAAWLAGQLAAAIARREPLASRTDGIRLLHGESDGIPAIVIDRFGEAVVISSYSSGMDAVARYLARLVRGPDGQRKDLHQTEGPSRPLAGQTEGPSRPLVGLLRPAKRRQGVVPDARVLWGTAPDVVRFTEDGVPFAVDPAGQKTGAYLDLRGLRRAVATAPIDNKRVLNLFAYSGMLGRAAEVAGAASITQVDASERALAFAAAHHVDDATRHVFVVADVFEWLPALDDSEQFDLVIVDPPSMTSSKAQVPAALAAYRRLYRAAARHVRPGGALVAACCTSRIERLTFHRVVRESLGAAFTRERELPVELDHPVGFPQADYLKIAWWRRTV
jgi:23S rRNA (cytosine1962-C5)-methyltransferase